MNASRLGLALIIFVMVFAVIWLGVSLYAGQSSLERTLNLYSGQSALNDQMSFLRLSAPILGLIGGLLSAGLVLAFSSSQAQDQ